MRTLGSDEVAILAAVRLAALATDPSAFGSTLEREHAFGPDDWRDRLGPPGVTLVAGDPVVGMAWGMPDADDPTLAHLYGMWVAPEARRQGIGRALVEAVAVWATGVGRRRVELTVVRGNTAAECLYAAAGCTPTGATEEARDGAIEVVLRRPLGHASVE